MILTTQYSNLLYLNIDPDLRLEHHDILYYTVPSCHIISYHHSHPFSPPSSILLSLRSSLTHPLPRCESSDIPFTSFLHSPHHKMRVRDSFDVRTMSVELSDSLSLLELNEYAEDLFKTGRSVTLFSLLFYLICFLLHPVSTVLYIHADQCSAVYSTSFPALLPCSLCVCSGAQCSELLSILFSLILPYSTPSAFPYHFVSSSSLPHPYLFSLIYPNPQSSIPPPLYTLSLDPFTSPSSTFRPTPPPSSHSFSSPLPHLPRGKRRLQLEHIKEELRYPWVDLRKSIGPPSESEMFTTITGTYMCVCTCASECTCRCRCACVYVVYLQEGVSLHGHRKSI